MSWLVNLLNDLIKTRMHIFETIFGRGHDIRTWNIRVFFLISLHYMVPKSSQIKSLYSFWHLAYITSSIVYYFFNLYTSSSRVIIQDSTSKTRDVQISLRCTTFYRMMNIKVRRMYCSYICFPMNIENKKYTQRPKHAPI